MSAYSADGAAATEEIGADAAKIKKNKLLEQIYRDFYARILEHLPEDRFRTVLELGSGGGFLKELAPHFITSECVAVPGIERVVDACRIDESFPDGALDGICALNVFHHLPNAAGFLRGAARVLRSGGRVVLVEPWFTPVGQWFHRMIHHEPWVHDPTFWGLVGEGRMTGANTRLPTSVFRDSDERFAREFPELEVVVREPFHKWLYLASGGLKLNTRIPEGVAKRLVALDRSLSQTDRWLGIFALVVVQRR